MIEAKKLTVGYGKRDVIRIDDIALIVGEVTALIGPNGAGKSTLIRCLAGHLRPKTGVVKVQGHIDAYQAKASLLARNLAFVSQEHTEPFAFTVRELVSMGAAANTAAVESRKDRVDRALNLMDLAEFAERDLIRLSGGERQRAALARALAQGTPNLLLDEPTAHLDLRHQAALMHACRAAAREQGTTIVVVLHDLNLASAFADRLILLNDGQIAADGPPDAVMKKDIISSLYQTHVLSVRDSESGTLWVHLMPPNDRSRSQSG